MLIHAHTAKVIDAPLRARKNRLKNLFLDRLFESDTSVMVPVQLQSRELHGFNETGPAHCISYFSTPAALAVCVAIASISGGDKQS